MNRIIPLILAAMMLLSLAACNQSQDPTIPSASAATTYPSAEVRVEASTEPPIAEDPKLGSYQDGTYTNSFLGIGCNLDGQWTILDNEELAEMNGIVADYVDDEGLAEMLRDSGVAYLFFASADNGSMNITLENLNLLYGATIDEKTYAELSVETLAAALESMGMSDVTSEITSITFAGAEHTAVTVHGIVSGADVYETIICIKVTNYMAALSVGCYYEDVTMDLLSLFYPLES